VTTGSGYMHANTPVAEPPVGPQIPSGVSSANGWHNGHLRALVLADRKTVKLERATLLQILAQRDTPDQVVADLVAMFTADESTS
jgi:hypothetical protein